MYPDRPDEDIESITLSLKKNKDKNTFLKSIKDYLIKKLNLIK